LKGKTNEEVESAVISKSIENLMQNIQQFNVSELEACRFFYLGKPNRAGVPSFYLILHRLEKHFLESTDLLIVYVYKVLWKYVNSPYLLVVDLSWARVNDEIQALFYKIVAAFSRLMKPEHLLNCKQIYVLHPSYKTMELMEEVLNLMDENKRNSLVRYIYEWNDLASTQTTSSTTTTDQAGFDTTAIWIPFVSKRFVPVVYSVLLLETKEKLLKLANDSLLFLDPKLGTLDLELSLTNIQEIRCLNNGSNELNIFHTGFPSSSSSSAGVIMDSNPGNLLVNKLKGSLYEAIQLTSTSTLKILCFSDSQRDLLMDTITDYAIRAISLSHPQAFEIFKSEEDLGSAVTQKQNKSSNTSSSIDVSKKKNNNNTIVGMTPLVRILRLTSDSLLLFVDRVVRKEVSFSNIQSFYLDTDNHKKFIINFTNKGAKKAFVFYCLHSDRLKDALLEAIYRFKFFVTTDIELFKKMKVDGVVERFYDNCKYTGDADKKWKISSVDFPAKALKKIHKNLQSAAQLTQGGNATATASLESSTVAVATSTSSSTTTEKKASNVVSSSNKIPLTVQILRDTSTALRINLNDEDIEHLMHTLDPKKKGFCTFDDLICQYLYSRKERLIVEKKKFAIALKKRE